MKRLIITAAPLALAGIVLLSGCSARTDKAWRSESTHSSVTVNEYVPQVFSAFKDYAAAYGDLSAELESFDDDKASAELENCKAALKAIIDLTPPDGYEALDAKLETAAFGELDYVNVTFDYCRLNAVGAENLTAEQTSALINAQQKLSDYAENPSLADAVKDITDAAKEDTDYTA